MFMQSDAVEVKVTGSAGTIVLNRPDFGNAMTRSMLEQFAEALDDLYRERRVRAIVITGAGDAFCEGADLLEVQACGDAPDAYAQWGQDAELWRETIVRMLEVTKPIVAAVNGPALGHGAALVAAADIAVADAGATFGLPDVRRGLVAGLAGPLLCFRLGAGQAARLLLTSQAIDAEEARRIGVFHEVVPAEKAWARAMEIVEHCAAGAPEAIQLTKRLLNETVAEQLLTQLTSGSALAATAHTTAAAEEGIAAFLDGRSPEWK
ncbi:MAG: enoyl-CoA hydratase/isomerase family protein [Planctomycetales bacterium]|nr:enoyl-CoA hydratase/isomerase family protein [Planctomycetales bacterium]